MHHLGRTGIDGEGADWGRVGGDQQERITHAIPDVHLAALGLNALTDGGAWVDNGSAVCLDVFFHILSYNDQLHVIDLAFRRYALSSIHLGDGN